MHVQLRTSDLKELRLFRGESSEVLKWVLQTAEERWLEQGTVLLEPARHNQSLYILLDGSLRIELEAENRAFVTFVERGECVGELSVLDGKTTAARVVAAEPSRLLVLRRKQLFELIERSHVIARNLLYLLSSRIRKNDEALSDSFILQQRYAHRARIDSLTGLYNRYWMDEMMPRFIERTRFDNGELGMVMLDVDHFKSFNDNHGHLAGDEVLRELGAIIRENLRPDDSAVRFGGEEFALLLPEMHARDVEELAERLRRVIYEQTSEDLRSMGLPGVTVSLGMAMLHPGQDGRELISEADAALYRAKRGGRNRVEIA